MFPCKHIVKKGNINAYFFRQPSSSVGLHMSYVRLSVNVDRAEHNVCLVGTLWTTYAGVDLASDALRNKKKYYR